MDGRRSFADDQESRWYPDERDRGYADPQWRGAGEARYREDEPRVAPEQRGDEDDRYGSPRRFGPADPHGDGSADSERYRASRSRRAEQGDPDISGELPTDRPGWRAAPRRVRPAAGRRRRSTRPAERRRRT
ncbi:hypothetical protein [Micromonospora tarapacensis]|uniref:hypothetical protein n=1 Tax=Micromonospora tarapacensis TaxID=2835305 RepID=UPI001E357A79|nr:hypothetical protein [Micromonospora tarapacensis]